MTTAQTDHSAALHLVLLKINLKETNAMHKALLFMMVLVGTVILLGCTAQQTSQSNAPQTPMVQTPHEDDHAALAAVPRISVAEADALVKKGQAILLDTRQESAYRIGHIKGAISMPEGEIANRVSMLPRDKKIITYCS